MKKQVLGVDCGNVILCQMNGTPVHGALNALREIVRSRMFVDSEENVNIWVVSKCGPRVQALTRDWLSDLDFWNYTGIPANQIRFCRKFWEKGPICQELGITDFIDDRPRVLNCLTSVSQCYAFNPDPRRIGDYRLARPLIIVRSWSELLRELLGS